MSRLRICRCVMRMGVISASSLRLFGLFCGWFIHQMLPCCTGLRAISITNVANRYRMIQETSSLILFVMRNSVWSHRFSAAWKGFERTTININQHCQTHHLLWQGEQWTMEALFPAFCLQIFGCQRLDVSICLNQTLFTGPSKSESERVTNTRCLAFLRLFQALKSKGSNVFKRLR